MQEARRQGKTSWIAFDTLYVADKAIREYGYDEGDIRILAWNVYGLSVPKRDDREFVDYLFKFDILLMYEK